MASAGLVSALCQDASTALNAAPRARPVLPIIHDRDMTKTGPSWVLLLWGTYCSGLVTCRCLCAACQAWVPEVPLRMAVRA
jgi:hypothetical protein